jgi:hypothetical protein
MVCVLSLHHPPPICTKNLVLLRELDVVTDLDAVREEPQCLSFEIFQVFLHLFFGKSLSCTHSLKGEEVRLVHCFAGINALEGIQPGLALDQMGEFGSYTRILSSILPGVTPGEKDIVTRRAIPPGRMLMIPWKEARDVLVQNLDPAMIHYRHTFVHYTPIQVSV